jgi:hypothetical protein
VLRRIDDEEKAKSDRASRSAATEDAFADASELREGVEAAFRRPPRRRARSLIARDARG